MHHDPKLVLLGLADDGLRYQRVPAFGWPASAFPELDVVRSLTGKKIDCPARLARAANGLEEPLDQRVLVGSAIG